MGPLKVRPRELHACADMNVTPLIEWIGLR